MKWHCRTQWEFIDHSLINIGSILENQLKLVTSSILLLNFLMISLDITSVNKYEKWLIKAIISWNWIHIHYISCPLGKNRYVFSLILQLHVCSTYFSWLSDCFFLFLLEFLYIFFDSVIAFFNVPFLAIFLMPNYIFLLFLL